jgi:hypothetical protein
MASSPVPGAADIADKGGHARVLPCKKRKHLTDDDETTIASGAKHRRVQSPILRPRSSNIVGHRSGGTRPEPLPPSAQSESGTLREFECSESQIKILEVAGSGDHAIVYRFSDRSRTLLVKVARIHMLSYINRTSNS